MVTSRKMAIIYVICQYGQQSLWKTIRTLFHQESIMPRQPTADRPR
jgi:hypothetical protein